MPFGLRKTSAARWDSLYCRRAGRCSLRDEPASRPDTTYRALCHCRRMLSRGGKRHATPRDSLYGGSWSDGPLNRSASDRRAVGCREAAAVRVPSAIAEPHLRVGDCQHHARQAGDRRSAPAPRLAEPDIRRPRRKREAAPRSRSAFPRLPRSRPESSTSPADRSRRSARPRTARPERTRYRGMREPTTAWRYPMGCTWLRSWPKRPTERSRGASGRSE
jgi:hypothetical protein